ncbi:hypothetical protein O181_061977 [Austropuccinia psidii MF-1]|uniref:Integrase catalytic domain-containing protein n=1 Tax=Austropuccinia psidii MF-1 TaxID=1389203 RepID=A0A9Q3ELS5_9BASI|nr:hypothetical protein [Austropuccinia psidii MF-1]
MKVVPSVCHQYLDVLSKVKAEKLPPNHACDHHIELEGSLPAVGVIYFLSNQESDTLRAYISENVEKCFIQPNSSSTGAPVLFVKKKDGGLCLCVDYCKLNAVTRKNKYPVHPMSQLLNFFNHSSISSKIDLCGTYNLLRIKEGEEHFTAFRTKYGSYEYLAMPFGLTNAPASFQSLFNGIFQDLLNFYVVDYLDDIMVFSKSEEEHVTHVSTVLTRLRANSLFAKASKPKDQPSKIPENSNWPPPRNLQTLQSFLGFANFYLCFIKNYSKKISSLTSFLKKDSCFPLNEEALSQFHHLSNPSLPTIVGTNASNYALGSVLSQVSDSGKHLIEFNSRTFIPAERNYEIHYKKLLGIVWALKRWRAFFLSLSLSFEVLTNHYSLHYFMTSKVLIPHQARWDEFFSEFKLSILYCPGCLATLPDALSCWDNVYLERGEDFISKNRMKFQYLIKQDEFQPSRYFAVKLELFPNLIDSIQKALWQDSQHRSILQELGKAGHPGQKKTLKFFKPNFHSSCMTQFIKDYVSSCQQCSRNKNIHQKEFGLLRPLPIPNGPWICLSIDFITPFALSNSFSSMLVIVDRFSKMAVFIPAMSPITLLDLAHFFIKNIVSKNGLPSSIVSDRGSIYVSSFWTHLCQQLKISRDLSTAYHPETDRQTQRVYQILEQYLQMYVSYHKDDWNTCPPLAKFAYNNSDHSSTKKFVFFTVYGRDPQFDSVHITQDTPSGNFSTKV